LLSRRFAAPPAQESRHQESNQPIAPFSVAMAIGNEETRAALLAGSIALSPLEREVEVTRTPMAIVRTVRSSIAPLDLDAGSFHYLVSGTSIITLHGPMSVFRCRKGAHHRHS
jgi:hypothetical protein